MFYEVEKEEGAGGMWRGGGMRKNGYRGGPTQ